MKEEERGLEGFVDALSDSLGKLKNAQSADDGFGVWLEAYLKALRSVKFDATSSENNGKNHGVCAAAFANEVANFAVEKYRTWE